MKAQNRRRTLLDGMKNRKGLGTQTSFANFGEKVRKKEGGVTNCKQGKFLKKSLFAKIHPGR
jgi:hypothetical protein